MYTLNEIWNSIFEQIKEVNDGVLADRESPTEYRIFLQNGKLKEKEKIHFLLGGELLGQYRTAPKIPPQFLEGKLLVKKSGCAAYRTVVTRLADSLAIDRFTQIREDGMRLRKMMENSAKAAVYVQDHPAHWDNTYVVGGAALHAVPLERWQDRLVKLSYRIYSKMQKDFFQKLVDKGLLPNRIPKPNYRDSRDNTVWELLAFLIYASLLFMDYSEAKDAMNQKIEEAVNRLETELREISQADPTGTKLDLKSYHDLIQTGKTTLAICRELVDNDNALYRLGDHHENEGSPELWAKFLEAYPETFQFLVYEGKIVGNYSLVTLSPEQVKQLKLGKLVENDFSLDKNAVLFRKGVYTLYILNYSVNLGFSTRENRVMLWEALLKQLEDFAVQEIFFKEVYVNVFRSDHEELYRELGFEFLVMNGEGKTYCLKNFPADLKWSGKKRLMQLYEKCPNNGQKE